EWDGGNERGPLAGRVETELTDRAESDGVAGALSGVSLAQALGAKKPSHSAPRTITPRARLAHRTTSTGRSRNPARASTAVSTLRPFSSRMTCSLRAFATATLTPGSGAGSFASRRRSEAVGRLADTAFDPVRSSGTPRNEGNRKRAC